MIKFINFIFLLKIIKKNIRKKIKTNSPLVKINKPEIIEKINIFFCDCFFNIENNNFKNSREKTICKFTDEICHKHKYLKE